MGLPAPVTIASGPGLRLSLPPTLTPHEGIGWNKVKAEYDGPTGPVLGWCSLIIITATAYLLSTYYAQHSVLSL